VTLRCSISAMASLILSVVSGSKPCLVTSRNLKIALSISMHSSHMGSPLDWAGANGSQSPIWPGGMTDDAGATGRGAFGSATRNAKPDALWRCFRTPCHERSRANRGKSERDLSRLLDRSVFGA
jgi:hypothetical protein